MLAAFAANILRTTGYRGTAVYPDDDAGFKAFCDTTVSFFENLEAANQNREIKQQLIPDIELWACYLGLSRQSVWIYEKRGGRWAEYIRRVKDLIAAGKKQLALHGTIPSLLAVFDLVNNHGYQNTNEFKLQRVPEPEKPEILLEDLPDLQAIEATTGNSKPACLPDFITTEVEDEET